MLHKVEFKITKTYASELNATKAAIAKFGSTDLRYFIMRTADNRFYPIFLGEAAVQAGVHFDFHVVM